MDRSTKLAARPAGLSPAHPPPSAGVRHELPARTRPFAYNPAPDGTSLQVAAARVLEGNWTGTSTVPSRGLYPHQWSWDSAFIAVGLRHLSPLRAQTELETLFAAQWGDGRVPHIVFNPAVPLDAYFPSPDFWRTSRAGRRAGAPRHLETSGLVQPPVHALAAWLVHCADPGLSRARGFLRRLGPALTAWHQYLLTARTRPAGDGRTLAAVLHPWEQGMDNSPCWDAALARVTPAAGFRRADLGHGAVPDRPTDLDYGRYVRLATDYRDGGYADTAGDFAAFALEDPAFNALLIASEHALARIADELGEHGPARAHEERARRLTGTLVDRLWSPRTGMFLSRDLATGQLVPECSVAGLLPLVLPHLPRRVVDALVDTLRGPRFGFDGTTRLVPSYDLTGHAYEPRRYWRGPAWFNTAWLLERGLRLHAARHADGQLRTLADQLEHAVLTLAPASGFAEYVDPRTGEGLGARGFGWTAALALDLLHDHSGSRSGGLWGAPRDGEDTHR